VSNQQSSNGEGSVAIFWGTEPGHCPVPVSGNIEFNLKLQLLGYIFVTNCSQKHG